MTSIIIPSKNVVNLTACVQSIQERDPGHRIIIVDDGLNLDPWPDVLDGNTIVAGQKPFIFARNVNIGIQAAESDDVIILNDDTRLLTPGGFSELARCAATYPRLGIMAASLTGCVGNLNQVHCPGGGVRPEQRMLCFVAVFIPRAVIQRVGLLDIAYCLDYGCEDGDYCYRVRQAGLRLAVCDRCVVEHGKLKSTYRADGGGLSFRRNAEVFLKKFGRSYYQEC